MAINRVAIQLNVSLGGTFVVLQWCRPRNYLHTNDTVMKIGNFEKVVKVNIHVHEIVLHKRYSCNWKIVNA